MSIKRQVILSSLLRLAIPALLDVATCFILEFFDVSHNTYAAVHMAALTTAMLYQYRLLNTWMELCASGEVDTK